MKLVYTVNVVENFIHTQLNSEVLNDGKQENVVYKNDANAHPYIMVITKV